MSTKSYYDEENDEILEFDGDWFAKARPMREIPELAGFFELRRKMGLFDRAPQQEEQEGKPSRSRLPRAMAG